MYRFLCQKNLCQSLSSKAKHLSSWICVNAMSVMNARQLSRIPELIFAGGMVGCHGNGAGLAVWYEWYEWYMQRAWYGMLDSAEVKEVEEVKKSHDFGSLC